MISPALAPVISPASWARMARARLAEQVLRVHQNAWLVLFPGVHPQMTLKILTKLKKVVIKSKLSNVHVKTENFWAKLVSNFYLAIYPPCCMRMLQPNCGSWNRDKKGKDERKQLHNSLSAIRCGVDQDFQVRQQFRNSCSSSCPPQNHLCQFPLPATNSISPLYTLNSPSSLPSTSATRWKINTIVATKSK